MHAFEEVWSRSRSRSRESYSAFHPSGVDKWGPALAGKEKLVRSIPLADECGVCR